MILKTKEIPMVRFRADLPKWLEPVGAAYIEIDARPGGQVNQVFMAGQDRIAMAQRARLASAGEDVASKVAASRESGTEWLGMVYDTCVIGWRTNMIDAETDLPVQPTRESFLDLANVPIVEVAQMFLDFQTAILEAGAEAAKADEDTIKN